MKCHPAWTLFLVAALGLLLGAFPAAAGDDRGPQAAAADALLKSPTLNLPQARQALALYEAQLSSAGPTPVFLWTRLAQVSFILGDLEAQGRRRDYYLKGRDNASLVLKHQPDNVAGHYWLALNLCGLADTGSKLEGYRLLPQFLEELNRVLKLEETFDQAGAHRVLGRIYYEAPGRPLSVGDLQKSLHHLTAAVRLAPDNSTNHLYLAETLIRLGNKDQARQELESTLKATRHAIHPGGLKDDQQKARRLLGEIGGN